MDAQVSYAFHSERKLHPEKFKNQLVNQSTYAKLGCTQGWFLAPLFHPSSRNIAQLLKVKVMKVPGEWMDLHIPHSIRSIVCLNLPSFSGGLNPWGEVKTCSPMPEYRSWKEVVSGQFSKFEIQGGNSTKKQEQSVVATKVARQQQKSGVAEQPTLLTKKVKGKGVVVDETPREEYSVVRHEENKTKGSQEMDDEEAGGPQYGKNIQLEETTKEEGKSRPFQALKSAMGKIESTKSESCSTFVLNTLETNSERDLTPPFVDDRLIEVVGFRDAWHGLVLLAPNGHGTRLAQVLDLYFVSSIFPSL
ncbi:Diacylglycerol kinase [Thalictrum thalictroides]|uniref:Diacylglycerol kinase n=1 Tax=Thalictrum thalictroides TaxID=46969 RepID=A0A7J6WTG8_THATH|nr:Diacylglycerol kinase [Thalictrum thalictroides]